MFPQVFYVPASGFKMSPQSAVPEKSFLCPAVFSVPVRVFSVPTLIATKNRVEWCFLLPHDSGELVCVCPHLCLRF